MVALRWPCISLGHLVLPRRLPLHSQDGANPLVSIHDLRHSHHLEHRITGEHIQPRVLAGPDCSHNFALLDLLIALHPRVSHTLSCVSPFLAHTALAGLCAHPALHTPHMQSCCCIRWFSSCIFLRDAKSVHTQRAHLLVSLHMVTLWLNQPHLSLHTCDHGMLPPTGLITSSCKCLLACLLVFLYSRSTFPIPRATPAHSDSYTSPFLAHLCPLMENSTWLAPRGLAHSCDLLTA